jgi:hypothetical protein
VIIRWEDAVRVGIFTDGLSPDVFADLKKNLMEIQQVTNHPITMVTEDVNFAIVISSNFESDFHAHEAVFKRFFPSAAGYQSFLSVYHQEKFACTGKFLTGAHFPVRPRAALIGDFAFIAMSDDKEMVEPCLLRQLMIGMGVLRRSTSGQYGGEVRSSERKLSDLDRSLLTLLYDRRLDNGMGASQAMGVVNRILDARP